MWDIEQIIEQNNQAALNAIMMPQKLTEAQEPKPEGWALSLLADILKVGPPLLTEMIECLNRVDTVREFVELVRMLLPEYEKDIMSAPRNRRVYKFCFFFGKKYYPLPANTDCPPTEWVNGMPVELMAMSYTAWHNMDMRPGFQLLLSLIIYPYEGDERDEEDDDVPFNPFDPMAKISRQLALDKYKPRASDIKWLKDLVDRLAIDGQWIAPMGFKMVKTAENKIKLTLAVDDANVRDTIKRTIMVAEKAGIKAEFKTTGRTAKEKLSAARVPLLDKVKQMVGETIASRIPAAGWTAEELHKMTDGTHYDGVGLFADWVCSETGCVVLDSSYEDCDYEEGDSEPTFKWTKHNVDILTEQWPRVKFIRGKMDYLVEWLEKDPNNHFNELVNWLIGYKLPKTRVAKRIYDPMERHVQLEQVDREDENDDSGE